MPRLAVPLGVLSSRHLILCHGVSFYHSAREGELPLNAATSTGLNGTDGSDHCGTPQDHHRPAGEDLQRLGDGLPASLSLLDPPLRLHTQALTIIFSPSTADANGWAIPADISSIDLTSFFSKETSITQHRFHRGWVTNAFSVSGSALFLVLSASGNTQWANFLFQSAETK